MGQQLWSRYGVKVGLIISFTIMIGSLALIPRYCEGALLVTLPGFLIGAGTLAADILIKNRRDRNGVH